MPPEDKCISEKGNHSTYYQNLIILMQSLTLERGDKGMLMYGI
jgi:hypothetical protein